MGLFLLPLQQVDFLCQSVRRLIHTPFTYPRFFFQTLQATNIKVFRVSRNPVNFTIMGHKNGEIICFLDVHLIFTKIQKCFFCGFQLAISPQQLSGLDPVQVHNETQLTVKVEGIVQHGRYRDLFRKVAKVQITATSELVNRTSNSTDQKVWFIFNYCNTDRINNHQY